jgi:pimeloyl-ACP methyl ester carboxylesterase
MGSAMRIRIFALLLLLFSLIACVSPYKPPDLGGLYNDLVQNESPHRNPVILIPGILGSRLVEKESGEIAWGTFGLGRINPNTADGARRIGLPMAEGQKLSELRDDLWPDFTLDQVTFNFMGYPLALNTYAHILSVLGVGGYRDQQSAEAGIVDYGDRHFTCFQFPYDWRRDIVESAAELDRFIKEKRKYVQGEIEKRFGIKDYDVKFDIVAHSMGGLVARYYLRYGVQDLPEDESLPKLTWDGSRHVDHLVMIGTPNAGSISAMLALVKGYRPAPLLPRYPAPVLGTMPGLYQLLPRSRHRPLLDDKGRPVEDIFAADLWQKNGWGLADPNQDPLMKLLLPDIQSPDERRRIALDHQRKALKRAKQFTAAIDIPAKLPASLHFFLVAGDSEDTDETARFGSDGNLSIVKKGPGDGSVLRRSALMDERRTGRRKERLISPIHWTQVLFLFSNHFDLTKDPAFTDNLLYFLLESQRNI